MPDRKQPTPWRNGEIHPVHVYQGDAPVATFFTAFDARLAVNAVNEIHRRADKESDKESDKEYVPVGGSTPGRWVWVPDDHNEPAVIQPRPRGPRDTILTGLNEENESAFDPSDFTLEPCRCGHLQQWHLGDKGPCTCCVCQDFSVFGETHEPTVWRCVCGHLRDWHVRNEGPCGFHKSTGQCSCQGFALLDVGELA